MANSAEVKKTVIKVPDNIECRIYGNVLGILIACGGLLAGVMVWQGSFSFWPDDVISIIILLVSGFSLFRNSMKLVASCILEERAVSNSGKKAGSAPSSAMSRENIEREIAAVASLPRQAGITAETVIEQVVRRIEAQKAEVTKNNKFTT